MVAQSMKHILKGLLCGAVGGVFAGALFGLTYALLGHVLPALSVYTIMGGLLGGIVGSLIGGGLGLTLPQSRQFISRLCQIVSVLVVTFISIAIPYSVEVGWEIRIFSGIVTGMIVGFFGGTVAFRCYVWLYE